MRTFKEYFSIKNLFCVFFSLLLSGCVLNSTKIHEAIAAAETEPDIMPKLELKLIEIKEKIILNILNGNDIDADIDVCEIKDLMNNYKLRPESYLVTIDAKPYDMPVITELLNIFEIIRTNWDVIKKENIQRIANEYAAAKIEHRYTDEYILMEAISYYVCQSEISAVFFQQIIEQFQLPGDQYDLSNLPEVIIDVSPLPITAINIDEIPFEYTAFETIHSLMRQKTSALMQNIRYELEREINTQFGICVSNVDAYLDWYYGFFTGLEKTWVMIQGGFDPNRTMGEALQDYMVKNYIEKIGNGTMFENYIIILQQFENIIMEQAFIFGSLLGDCILEYYTAAESIQDISGDDYMMPFIALSDYLNLIVTEGLQLMSMGDKLDTDGILLLDIANIVINFIPGVGFIAGTIVDAVTLKLTEHLKRPDFEMEIISSICAEKERLLAVISLENYGGKNEILF